MSGTQSRTVAQLLLDYLALEGVDTLFGIPGAALGTLLDALKNDRARFRYVLCRHETGAAYAADGYARVTGGLGVVLVTSGPGATNALTGVLNGHDSGSPILAITGEPPESTFGKGYLQEGVDGTVDVNTIYRAASRYSAVLTAAGNFHTLTRQALRDARSIPRRAAHLSLPDDVAAATPDGVAMPASPASYRVEPDGCNADRARQMLAALVAAAYPAILLGSGARAALQGKGLAAFTALVEHYAIAVMTTPEAKGIFPESHPLSLRNYGTAACTWPRRYLQPASVDPSLPPAYDALLVLGSSLGGFTTAKWNPMLAPAGPLMQVDLDQRVIGRGFPIALGAVAEVGAFLDALARLAPGLPADPGRIAARAAFVARIKATGSPYADPAARDSERTPIHPAALMKCVSALVPAGAHLFIDCANCVGWSTHYLDVDPPTQVHTALAMGPMGFGVAAVVGGQLGAPDVPCVAIVGDGAFLMHGNEVATASQYGIGAVWIVLRDGDLGMVSQGQAVAHPDPGQPEVWKHYYAIGHPDLVRFAAGLGADTCEVRSPADARRAIPAALAQARATRRPQVIVADVDTDAVPPYYGRP
jgi:acetolactate synthase-1/2/3 large subunit